MKTTRFESVFRPLPCLAALILCLGAGVSPEREVELPDLSKRVNAFTFDVLRHEAKGASAPDNLVVSPQGIFHGVAMSYIASGGDTRRELATVFHFPESNQMLLRDLAQFRRQLTAIEKKPAYEVSFANAIWLDETHAQYRKEYLREIEAAFGTTPQRIRFAPTDQASQTINQWIQRQTHGLIPSGIAPGDLPSKSRLGIIDEPALVTVNAVYFNAAWEARFVESATHKGAFQTKATGKVETLLMRQRSLLPYAEDATVKFLELPYTGGLFSMYVILPKDFTPISKMLENLSPDTLFALKRGAQVHEVDVLLPKFQMTSRLDLKEALREWGVKTAFDPQAADFDQMIIKRPEAFRVYQDVISHAACIEVEEKGTKAAAVTVTTHRSFGCSAPARPQLVQFHADHPFAFLIVHNQSRSVLFAGWMSNPAELDKPSHKGRK